MKHVGIITIIDSNNYGNRLQNYALQFYLMNNDMQVYTLKNNPFFNTKKHFLINFFYYYYKRILNTILNKQNINYRERVKAFKAFDSNIFYYKKRVTAFSNLNIFDYLVVGSDQVWNPYYNRLSDLEVLSGVDNNKKISYAASFGVNELDTNSESKIKNEISTFKSISVREDSAKKIIEKLTNRKDIEVLVDPTMLLTSEEWDKVSKKPKQLDKLNNRKYILNYFLGDLSEPRKKEIERIAKENNCCIINILDKNDPFYVSGPSEFLYLEKNAFLICTDSFHSSVFAILYNRPFIIYDREQDDIEKMNSRIDTLLTKFKLKNRTYNGHKITNLNLNHDYSEAYVILEKEREKANNYIKDTLNL